MLLFTLLSQLSLFGVGSHVRNVGVVLILYVTALRALWYHAGKVLIELCPV